MQVDNQAADVGSLVRPGIDAEVEDRGNISVTNMYLHMSCTVTVVGKTRASWHENSSQVRSPDTVADCQRELQTAMARAWTCS